MLKNLILVRVNIKLHDWKSPKFWVERNEGISQSVVKAEHKVTIKLTEIEFLVVLALVIDFILGDLQVFVRKQVDESENRDNEHEYFLS